MAECGTVNEDLGVAGEGGGVRSVVGQKAEEDKSKGDELWDLLFEDSGVFGHKTEGT